MPPTYNIKSLLKEIREDIKNKNYNVAIKKCEEILSNESNNYMALVFLGAAYQEKDKKEAAKYLRKAVNCDNNPIYALQGLLNCAENDEMPEILQKLLQFVPEKYEEYHKKLVFIACTQKTSEKSIEVLKNEIISLENNEDSNSERLNSACKCIAKILIEQNEIPEKWEELFEKSLKIIWNDRNFDNYLIYAKRYLKLLYKLNKLTELLERASDLHEHYQDDVYPLEWICKIYTENYQNSTIKFEEHLKEPIEYYSSKLFNLSSNSILGLFVKGILFFEKQDYVNSRNFLTKVCSILQSSKKQTCNDYINASILLAKCHMKLGAYGIALSIWKKCKIIDINLAICLSYSDDCEDDLKECIEIIERCSEKFENFEVMEAYARALCQLKQDEKLKEFLSQSKENGNSENALLLEAEFLMEPTDAIQTITKLSSLSIFVTNFTKGRKYFELKDYGNALNNLLLATKERPYYSDCFMFLGLCYSAIKDLNRSRKCFEKCVDLNQQNQIAVTNLCGIYRNNEEWELIAELLEKTIQNFENYNNKCAWAMFQLGLHYLYTNQYDQAIRLLQNVVRLDINKIIYWETLADAYYQRGSYQSSLKVNQKILEMDPTNLIAKLQTANIKTTLRMYTEAIELFDDILSENSDFIPALKGAADAHHGLAQNLLSQRLIGRCRDHMQYAVDRLTQVNKRTFLWFWRSLGNIFTFVGCLPKSKSFLRISKKLINRNQDLIKDDDLFQYAENFYSCALKLNPDDHLLWHEVALMYYNRGIRIEDAEKSKIYLKLAAKTCKHSIKLNATRWENWNLLGVIFGTKQWHIPKLAQHCFIQALNIDKRAAIPWSNLGTLYLIHNDIKLANKAYKKAQQSNPNYQNGWIGQALIAEIVAEDLESMDIFRHCTQLGFHLESSIGYAYWVCSTLSDPEKMKDPDYKYSIEKMHAIPLALDSMTWYFAVEEDNSSIEALSYYGYLNYKLGLWNLAIKAFLLASQKTDDAKIKDSLLCNLGYSYLKNQQYDKATEVFGKIQEATFITTVGLAFSYWKDGKLEDAYSMYSSALEWLTSTDFEKSSILMEMSAIVYSINGENDTKPVLYQLLALPEKPIQSLYFACALGIIHKDWNLTEAVLDELKKLENNPKYCHDIAFLTACYYSANKLPRKGLIHLQSRIHIFPNQSLLRKALAEYLLKHSSKSKKHLHEAASKIAQSVVQLGLIRMTTSLEAAKALTIASISAGITNQKKQRILAQSAIHIQPNYTEAWNTLKACT